MACIKAAAPPGCDFSAIDHFHSQLSDQLSQQYRKIYPGLIGPIWAHLPIAFLNNLTRLQHARDTVRIRLNAVFNQYKRLDSAREGEPVLGAFE